MLIVCRITQSSGRLLCLRCFYICLRHFFPEALLPCFLCPIILFSRILFIGRILTYRIISLLLGFNLCCHIFALRRHSMPPPYSNVWNYFRADAVAYINANRNWTPAQRNHTVSTIWAGHPAVKYHYDVGTLDAHGGRTVLSPGLPIPNPIPVVPYTLAHVHYAKATGTLPMLAPPPAPTLLPVPVPIPAPAPVPDPAPTSAPEPRYVSSQLHDFWPRLPWSPEPRLPPFDAEVIKTDKASKDAWLGTKPLMSPSRDESQWRGVLMLGSGAFGAAGLWVQTDAANNIQDRMVIKEATTFVNSQWRDPRNWRDRLPREIRIHELVEERRIVEPDSCRHLIHCRGHRLWMRLKRYRLYLDFQAGGDIYHAVYPYIRNWYKKYPSQNQFIPEGFIWYMLKALATACLVLQKGTVSGGEVEGWRSITHLDLQTTNVLLDTTALLKEEPLDEPLGIFHEADTQELGGSDKAVDGSNTNWGKEPPFVPILTDFGISFFSPESHGCPLSDNPEDFLISVCGRYPPEMHQQSPPYQIKLGEKTDVWGIGNIAWTLITNSYGDHGPIRCDGGNKSTYFARFSSQVPVAVECERNNAPHDEHGVLAEGCRRCRAASKYSQRIKDLVRRCVNFNQADRPSLTDIIAQANEVLVKGSPEMDQVMYRDGLHFTIPNSKGFAIGDHLP